MTSINLLPDDMLVLLFGLLEIKTLVQVVPLVCKRWRGVLKAYVSLNFNIESYTDESVETLSCSVPQAINRFKTVVCLNDVVFKQVTKKCILYIGSGYPDIDSLILEHVSKVTDKGLISIASGCPSLANLNIELCKKVTDEGLIAIASHCHALISLYIAWCNVTDIGIKAIGSGCLAINSLNLEHCDAVTDEGLVSLGAHCYGLTDLNISA